MRSLVFSLCLFFTTALQGKQISTFPAQIDFRFGDEIEIPEDFEKAGTFKVTAPEGVDTTQFEVSVIQCPIDTHGGPTFGGCARSRRVLKINEEGRVIPGYYLLVVFDRPDHRIAYKALTIADKDQITLPLTTLKIKKGTSGPVQVAIYPDYGDKDNWLAYLRIIWGAIASDVVDRTNIYGNVCGNLSNTPRFPVLKPICAKLMQGITKPEDLDGFLNRRNDSGDLESFESRYTADYSIYEAGWKLVKDGYINQLHDGESVLVFPGVYALHFTAENGQTIVKRGVRVDASL